MTNGLPESFVRKPGALPHSADSWLVGLPVAVRPGARSMMLIGLGGGSAAADIPPSIEQVDVVELSEAVVRANRATSGRRYRNSFDDPRIKLVINDARNALRLSAKKYDVIVSQPSHPWTAGASHLYTREFAELVHSRLSERGVFLQWVGEQFLDAELLRSVAATLCDVFPHVRLYQPVDGSLLWVASDHPLQPEQHPRLALAEADAGYFYSLGLSSPTDLLGYLSVDDEGVKQLASSADLIRDERNLLAMRAPRLVHRPAIGAVDEVLAEVHPVRKGIAHVRSLCPAVNVPYYLRLIRGIHEEGFVEQFAMDLLEDQDARALAIAELARSRSGEAEWLRFLEGQRETRYAETAFHVLRADQANGLRPQLSSVERDRLRSVIPDKQQMLLEILSATQRGEIGPVRREDALLGSFGPEEAGFRQALLLRLLWRIKENAPARTLRSSEVIALTDRYAAYVHVERWGYYRTLAAIFSGRDDIALSTIAEMTSQLEAQLSTGEPPSNDLVAAIEKVVPLLENDQLFPNSRLRRIEVLGYLRGLRRR